MELGKVLKKILVIEDDAAIRDSLKELLEFENYQVIMAEHGLKAMEILKGESNPDLLLLDLSMPVMDGRTFLKEMRKTLTELSHLPIIIMTAAGLSNLPENHPKEWVLKKPLDINELLSKIEEVSPN
jgi:CheY-like chemotaxis protein